MSEKPAMSHKGDSAPLAVDLFCGLGGWTEGLLAEGYRVVGFDIEQHVYGAHRYPAQLVLQDVRTLHGAQFKAAALIVASPPCQAYSYRAMPWTRAKALPPPDNALFNACFRIQQEASAAAGRHIPMVVENVQGAQRWVGRARWHFGSFYLWGDVPALMPIAKAIKGGSWFTIAHNTASGCGKNPVNGYRQISDAWRSKAGQTAEGMGLKGGGDGWFNDAKRKGGTETGRLSKSGSKSAARKAASAMIAKIPLVLSRHIAAAWWPDDASGSGTSHAGRSPETRGR